MFVHFLITRFNIIQDWYTAANRNNSNIQSEEWLEERFRLFEQYCFPSVANQNTDDFVWFVLFNSETPDNYKIKVAEFEKRCKMFTPLYFEPYADENALVVQYMNEYITNNTTHIITTRLDNDDMIRNDYISLIQSAFQDDFDDVFLNYAHGYQFLEERKVLYDYQGQDQGHYISRIVKRKNSSNTVLVDHSKVASMSKYIELNIDSGPAWVETIHKCNTWNRIAGRKPIFNYDCNRFPQFYLSKYEFIVARMSYYINYTYRWIKRRVEKYIINRFF